MLGELFDRCRIANCNQNTYRWKDPIMTDYLMPEHAAPGHGDGYTLFFSNWIRT